MPEPADKRDLHRNLDRYQCPPFFSAHINSGGKVEERATVENLSMRGLSARTSCNFEQGSIAEIELNSKYVPSIRVQARVKWVKPPECEGTSHLVGFSIHKVRIVDWFRFMRLIAQVRKEVW